MDTGDLDPVAPAGATAWPPALLSADGQLARGDLTTVPLSPRLEGHHDTILRNKTTFRSASISSRHLEYNASKRPTAASASFPYIPGTVLLPGQLERIRSGVEDGSTGRPTISWPPEDVSSSEPPIWRF
jgi:hypothetical protein